MALRIGFIGAGGNVRLRHAPGFRAIPDVEFTAVCNRSAESSARAAAEFGIGRVCETPAELIGAADVDAVCIGTWPYRHREYTVAALRAGKHVLCEARMAMDAGEGAEMLAVSREFPGLVAQLVPAPFDFRLGPTIMRLISEGALGDITEASIQVLNASGLDPAAPLQWRHRSDYSGHNIMMLGIYNEIAQRWLGDTRSLYARGSVTVSARRDPETGTTMKIEIPDALHIVAELASGPAVLYHVSNVAGGAPFSGILVHGTKATLRWSPDDTAQLVPHGGEAVPIEPDPGTDRGWCVEADFVDSIREGTPVRLTSFEDGLKYMRFTDACWQSWREGRVVSL